MSSGAQAPRSRSRDGRFAVESTPEAEVGDLAGPTSPTRSEDTALLGLPEWDPVAYFGAAAADLDTGPGSFDKCKATSAEYTRHLRARGIDASWVQVAGRIGDLPEVQPRWREMGQEHWQHYVTLVRDDRDGDYVVDFANRQFEPDSPWPLVVEREAFESDWTGVYPIDDDTLDGWCSTIDHEQHIRMLDEAKTARAEKAAQRRRARAAS